MPTVDHFSYDGENWVPLIIVTSHLDDITPWVVSKVSVYAFIGGLDFPHPKLLVAPSLLQMGSLPSFVDLTDSLGLEQEQTSPADQSPSPQLRSPVVGWKNAPTKSSSSPSLRDVATLHHISRYSPYPSLVRHVLHFI